IGDIGKSSVMVVAIERALGFLAAKRHGDTGRIGEINIQPAVLVVVEKQYTTAHGFHDVLLLGRNRMLKMDLAGGSHIAEVEIGGGFFLPCRFLWPRRELQQPSEHDQTAKASQKHGGKGGSQETFL